MEKSLTVKYIEFKRGLIDLINKSNLPPFIIQYVLRETLELVNNLCSDDIKNELSVYEKAKEEEENGNTDDESTVC